LHFVNIKIVKLRRKKDQGRLKCKIKPKPRQYVQLLLLLLLIIIIFTRMTQAKVKEVKYRGRSEDGINQKKSALRHASRESVPH